MSRPSESGSVPTPRRAIPGAVAATSADARSAARPPGGRRAAGRVSVAGLGSRSEEGGGVPGAAGREARAP
jgi:hypothetical protein